MASVNGSALAPLSGFPTKTPPTGNERLLAEALVSGLKVSSPDGPSGHSTMSLSSAADVQALFNTPTVAKNPAAFIQNVVLGKTNLTFEMTPAAQTALAGQIGKLPEPGRSKLFDGLMSALAPTPAQLTGFKTAFNGPAAPRVPPAQLPANDPIRQTMANAQASAQQLVGVERRQFSSMDLVKMRQELDQQSAGFANAIAGGDKNVQGSAAFKAFEQKIADFAGDAQFQRIGLPPNVDWKGIVGPAIRNIVDATKSNFELKLKAPPGAVGGGVFTFDKKGAEPVIATPGLFVSEIGYRGL
jgi:hypothetical protein